MQINASSGTIYPELNDNVSGNPSLVNLASGNVLYGNGNKASVNTGNAPGGTLYGTDNTSISDSNSTSIDRSTDIKLQEDTRKKLEEYKKQINSWKNQKSSTNLVKNYGLDMNCKVNNKNTTEGKSNNNSNSYKSFKDVRKIVGIDEKDRRETDGKVEFDFEPISFSKQKERIESLSSKEKENESKEIREFSGDSGSSNRKRVHGSINGRSKKVGKKRSRKGSKKTKKIKNATKASLAASSGVVAKLLSAFWGLGSALFGQDVLFRLILGIFLGAAFVAVVLVWN